MIVTDFCCGLDPGLTEFKIGDGALAFEKEGLRLSIPANDGSRYHDAQIMDYAGLARADYPWQPTPDHAIRLTVDASFSHRAADFRGTAGFGLWNQPIMPGQRWPRLPRAAWFFMAGQTCNMALAKGVPGMGWKAATLDATRLPFLALAPTAPLGVLLMRNRAIYKRLYPVGQWALGVAEALIELDTRTTHRYVMEWSQRALTFRVDDQLLMHSRIAPRGTLGFVAWVDNQYAVVTPQGALGFGLTGALNEQWMCLKSLRLEKVAH